MTNSSFFDIKNLATRVLLVNHYSKYKTRSLQNFADRITYGNDGLFYYIAEWVKRGKEKDSKGKELL